MAKIINLEKYRKSKQTKEYAPPNKHYKLGEASKYIYVQNLLQCIRLYLVQPGEYPALEELEEMPVYQARKIMKNLNTIFDEQADKRHKALTGKTLEEAAVEKMAQMFNGMFGEEE